MRVMVVEDEPLARERLANLLRARAGVELVACCASGEEALIALDGIAVDLLLLDIEMPGIDGITLLRRAARDVLAILTTAHARFALDAFDHAAIDYLLKPFDGARLDQALARARERLDARAAMRATERIRHALQDLPGARDAPAQAAEPPRLMVREQGRTKFVRLEQIDWIEADGHLCRLHCGATSYAIDGPLARWTQRLPRQRFVLVNRSALVNIERIVELQELFKGNAVALLRNGAEVPVSRRQRAALLERLGG